MTTHQRCRLVTSEPELQGPPPRPLALIPVMVKIMNSMIKTRLEVFVEPNKIISNKQYGFRKRMSTCNSLTSLQLQVVNAKASGHTSLVTFLDISGAYNSVIIKTLIEFIRPDSNPTSCKLDGQDDKRKWLCIFSQFHQAGSTSHLSGNVVRNLPVGAVLVRGRSHDSSYYRFLHSAETPFWKVLPGRDSHNGDRRAVHLWDPELSGDSLRLQGFFDADAAAPGIPVGRWTDRPGRGSGIHTDISYFITPPLPGRKNGFDELPNGA
ncbi:hypothetical protein GE061_003776 [Apolygus lucorum]|uniref:Reverse transcriptase domain-containing protein n=1 Tax=Apolygus lucorum TaxID=248454 RepID=A0A8S9X4Q8_APOLU|nr:hypothetical protein GE061_003776 [Apolygus lucorum]